jgi:predicted AAA+ superfamily ATPase
MPEYAAENREAVVSPEGELHPGETAEEKLSLSDRFGLLLPFFSFDQGTYLRIVEHHARELGLEIDPDDLRARALRFALERAGRSGRTARQACVAILQEEAER